jgi:hypothetical protein
MNDSKSLLEKFKIKKGFNLISLPTISLTEQEADKFIDYMVDESTMKNYARIERMSKPMKNIRALGFGSGDFLYPADQFDETKYKKQWAQNKIVLTTKKARGAIVVFDDDIEDLGGMMTEAQYNDQLMRIVTKKIANEMEAAFWSGEMAGPNAWAADSIKSMWDGWRYRVVNSASGAAYYNTVTGGAHILNACEGGTTGNEYQFAGKIAEQGTTAPYNWEFKYFQMLKEMPSKYKAANGLANMVFMNSDLVTQDYFMALSSRGTAIGDAVFNGTTQNRVGGVPIIDIPLMPTNLGDPTATPNTDGVVGGGAYTDVLLTPKNNLIIGIQRDIKIESKREAADEATYIFYSLRMDVAIENVDAVVLLRCLEHAC